jgi:hypothetical protein
MPIPSALEDINQLERMGLGDFILACQFMIDGINNVDAASYQRALDLVNSGSELLGQATAEIKGLNQ